MEGLVQIVGLLLICLMFVAIALQQRRSSEGFSNEVEDSVPASLKDANNMVMSKEPDLCSSLPAVDCNKTLGCEYSADVGLCVKKHLVREAAAHGDAMRSALEHFENYMPNAGPQPANAEMY
jgi:hypothetical protein